MIPFQLALLGWIAVSFLCMADRNNARGFSLAMIIGFLILPEARGVGIHGLPDLSKVNVTVLGTLLGTIVFHPNTLLKFRPHVTDLFLLAMMGFAVTTSVVNGFGAYDGASTAFARSLEYAFPICLARIHLGTPGQLKQFLIILILASVAYTPFALWEFRMSPQIHTKLYGYFQHVFVQFYRNGFWRPVVCFRHALDLGRFFALCSFLAAFPLRKELAQRFPFGGWLFLAPLLGLVISMSYGPYFIFLTFIGLYHVPKRLFPLAYLIPAAAILWLGLVFMDIQPLNPVIDFIGKYNSERAASAQYRLDAIRDYSYVIREQPVFGHGGWSSGRIEGIATDSLALIELLARGGAGLFCVFGWWIYAMLATYRLARKTENTRFGDLAYALTTVVPICLAFTVFDSALDPHVKLISAGVIAINGMALQPLPARAFRAGVPRRKSIDIPHARTI